MSLKGFGTHTENIKIEYHLEKQYLAVLEERHFFQKSPWSELVYRTRAQGETVISEHDRSLKLIKSLGISIIKGFRM